MKCKHCGTKHSNHEIDGIKLKDVCLNCESLEKLFLATVEAINRHNPIIGKPRKIEIIKYKISKR